MNLVATNPLQSDSLCRHYASASGQPQSVSHFPPSQTFPNTPHKNTRSGAVPTERCKNQEGGRSRSSEAGLTFLDKDSVLFVQCPYDTVPHRRTSNTLLLKDSSVKHIHHTASHNITQLQLICQIEQKGFTKALSMAAFCTDLRLKKACKLLPAWADTCPPIRHLTLLICFFHFFACSRIKE